jgi:hypothetical protein
MAIFDGIVFLRYTGVILNCISTTYRGNTESDTGDTQNLILEM